MTAGLRYFADLAHEAERAVRWREDRASELASRIGEAAASRELHVWRAVAAKWRAGVDGTPLPAPAALLFDRVDVLRTSLRRAEAGARRAIANAPEDIRQMLAGGAALTAIDHLPGAQAVIDAHAQLGRVDALLDWEWRARGCDPRATIADIVELNHALRAQVAAKDAA